MDVRRSVPDRKYFLVHNDDDDNENSIEDKDEYPGDPANDSGSPYHFDVELEVPVSSSVMKYWNEEQKAALVEVTAPSTTRHFVGTIDGTNGTAVRDFWITCPCRVTGEVALASAISRSQSHRYPRKFKMTVSYKSAGSRAVWAACFIAMFLNLPALAHADYPSFPITVELGPGSDDFKNQVRGGDAGFTEIAQSFSRLNGYDLSNRDLRMAELHLYGFELTGVRFDGADLTAANLVETVFDNCSFRNAIMRRVNLAGARHVNSNCDLTGADISGSNIWLSREQLRSTKSYQLKDLSSSTLTGDFQGVDFAGFNLNGTTLNSDLAGCKMAGASILGSTLQLSEEQLTSTKTFETGDINSLTLRGGDFTGFDFSKLNLGLFISCDLSRADFTDACFAPGTNRGNGRVGKSHGFIKCEIAPGQLYSTRNYKLRKFPPGFHFEGMSLAGWDFGGLDLRGVTFHVCDMTGANLEGVRGGIFRSAKGLTAEQVESTWNYRNNKMTEAGFELPSSLAPEIRPE